MLWKILGLVVAAFVAGGVIGATPRLQDEDRVSRAFLCGFARRGMEPVAPFAPPSDFKVREAYEGECERYRQVAVERASATQSR